MTIADSVAITAHMEAVILGGSSTSHMEEPRKRSLRKWKQLSTRITVIRRFARKYSAKSFQFDIAPGLTAASPQLISTVKDLLEKSNTSEGSKTRNLSTALNSGTLFGPNAPVQDEPKQKFKLGTLEKKNGEGLSYQKGHVFKDHLALSTVQILLTLLTFKILDEADLDEAFGLIIVTVIALDSRQEGTTATYNHVVRTVLKALFFLIWFSTSEKSGVKAQGDSEDGNLECPNERVVLPYIVPYIVQAAAWTFLAGIVMIVVIAGRINRGPRVPVPPAGPPAVPIAIGFVNVDAVLGEDPNPARISNRNFDIPPLLQLD